MRNAAADPKGVIRMVDKKRFGRVTSGGKCEQGDYIIRIEVQDNNIGILAQTSQLARLLQRFSNGCGEWVDRASAFGYRLL